MKRSDNTPRGKVHWIIRAGGSCAAMAASPLARFSRQRVPGEDVNLKGRFETVLNDPSEKPLPPTRSYPPMPRATVGMAGVNGSVYNAVREAVEAAGGLAEIEPGQRVMIKPNITGPATPTVFDGPITTSPEVVRAVIRLVKERGAHPMVGDRSMMMTELAFRTTGFARVCREEGAEAYPWTRSEYVRFYPGKRHWSKGFRMPRILQEVDHFINVPILKNHENSSQFTCCLKALVGAVMPLDRWQEGPDALHQRNISEKIAELNLCLKPTINIVDANSVMVKGGPGDGLLRGDPMNRKAVWAEPGLVLAGKDRVACDSAALAVLKLYGHDKKVDSRFMKRSVWDQVQIYYSAQLGLGQAEPDKINIEDLKARRFDEIKDNWK